MYTRIAYVFAFLLAYCIPNTARAHEVYVLSQDTITQAMNTPAFSEWQVIFNNIDTFAFWGFITLIVIVIAFGASVLHALEHTLDPMLLKLPPYAPVVGRITIALSFLAAAYYQALFGPELPLAQVFGGYAPLVTAVLISIGVMILIGWYTRVAALAALALFVAALTTQGLYVFTYTNYLGEILVLLILGAHILSVHHKGHDTVNAPRWFLRIKTALTPYAFLIIRVTFGLSLIIASVYAKVVHNNLALELTRSYPDLVAFFGFEPHFLVLGAAIIEILIGLFFTFGILIRFTSFFLLFWLTLSLWYFGEIVWPHIILIGIPISFILYGYDRYTLEGYFFKKHGTEPVL